MDTNQARRLGQAFKMGLAFSLGRGLAGGQIAVDSNISKKIQRWITVKKTHVPIGENGKPVTKLGKKILDEKQDKKEENKKSNLRLVGPDKLPTFDDFINSDEQKSKGNSFTANVRDYAETHLKPIVEALRYPEGMPPDCEKIIMGPKQIRELASHMNPDKIAVLPYVVDAYRHGKFKIGEDEKHSEVKSVVYTTKNVKVGGNVYFVELISKALRDKTFNGKYLQYGISKADKVGEDQKMRQTTYQFLGIKIKKSSE